MTLTLIRHARRGVSLIGIALLGVVVVFTILTHLAPLAGRHLFIVGGASMEPSIPLGSLVIATQTDPMKLAPGDVVTIRADSGIVITHRVHRIVDLEEGRFFELKGDANQGPDATLVPARAIVGAADRYIPFAGFLQEYLATMPGLLSAVGSLAALFLVHILLEAAERHARPIPAEAPDLVGP
jgi:signal peptidase